MWSYMTGGLKIKVDSTEILHFRTKLCDMVKAVFKGLQTRRATLCLMSPKKEE